MHVMARVYAHELRPDRKRERERGRGGGVVSIPGVEGNISVRNCRSMRRNRNSVKRCYCRGKHGNCERTLIKCHSFDGYFTLDIDHRYDPVSSVEITR